MAAHGEARRKAGPAASPSDRPERPDAHPRNHFANPHALSSFSLPVTGGPRSMPCDPGTFTVHRIEGGGYNDPSAAAALGAGALEGPKRGATGGTPSPQPARNRWMSRPPCISRCSTTAVRRCTSPRPTRLNYHSVIGRTKVAVAYTGNAGFPGQFGQANPRYPLTCAYQEATGA